MLRYEVFNPLLISEPPNLASEGAINPLGCTGSREELEEPLAIPSSATFQASVPGILQPQQVHPRLVALDLPGKGEETALSMENPHLPC